MKLVISKNEEDYERHVDDLINAKDKTQGFVMDLFNAKVRRRKVKKVVSQFIQ